MPAPTVYREIREALNRHIDPAVSDATRERLALLVLGIMEAGAAAPRRIAKALQALGLSGADAESIERRIRRIENDPQVTAALCVHPFARQHLLLGQPKRLVLVLDATTKEDDVVMLSAAVWYRGRALPLAWAIWPANTPLTGQRFWARVQALLDIVAQLLPLGVPVTWLADRAFGTPAFTDRVEAHGWQYIVRVQDQTRYQDQRGREGRIRDLVHQPDQRARLRGQVFKKHHWRQASVVVYWGRGHKGPLCLVTSLPPSWCVLNLYRRRYGIEATFRDYKSQGWRWEQGQVSDLAHLEHLLVGMALAMWVAMLLGEQAAEELLCKAAGRYRRTAPPEAKESLFSSGLQRLRGALHGDWPMRLARCLRHWDAPNWETEVRNLCARVWIFALKQAYALAKIVKVQLYPVRP